MMGGEKMKKLEWSKPVLELLGGAITNGNFGTLGSCKNGSSYSEICGTGGSPTGSCGSGFTVTNKCQNGTGIGQ